MRSELDVKIFLLRQAAGVEQECATPLAGAFHHHFLQSLSDRFLMRQRIPFGIDFYVRQRAGNSSELNPSGQETKPTGKLFESIRNEGK